MSAQAQYDEVEILPQTDDTVLCVTLHGVVHYDIYKNNFYKRMKDIIDKKGKFCLLVNYADDYKGWEQDAAGASLGSIAEFGKYARRMAYVNAPDSRHKLMDMTKDMLGGEVRYFKKGELDKATAWVKDCS